MIRTGIVGVSGYTGYELYKLLRRHPAVDLVWLTSETYAGQSLSDVFPCPWDEPLLSLAQAPLDEADLVFLCLPHATSMPAVAAVYAAGARVIDLSADFRLHDPITYQHWYGLPHGQPQLLSLAVYGLPELHRSRIAGSNLVANPGCYPTSAILGLWPLAKIGWLQGRVIVDSKSGVSGAGRKAKLSNSFVEANENFSPYSIGYAHRHVAEMEQELGGTSNLEFGNSNLQSPTSKLDIRNSDLHFIFSPHLLPVSRGILSTMYASLPTGLGEREVRELYRETYGAETFVHVLPPGQVATLQHTVHSNRCAIGLTLVPHPTDPSNGPTFIVTSSLDNLLKGAAGQAVQNMNVMFGIQETTGLGA